MGFLFQKCYFWVRRGGWNNSIPLQSKFWGGIGRGDFVLGMGTILRGWFLGGMGGRSSVISQGSKVEFFFVLFSKELFFWWYGIGWLEKGGGYFFSFLFFFLS